MQAAWYESLGKAEDVLRVGSVPTPRPGAGEVLVQIHASGVNPSDTKKRAGWLGSTLEFERIIPHSDGAGVIEAVGERIDETRIGERVWVYNAQFCRANGTAAEYVVVPGDMAVPLLDTTSFIEGACLGVPACTAHNALFWSGPINNMTVLVQGGAGVVAGYAIQLAALSDARVIATVSCQEKAKIATDLGADLTINHTTQDAAETILEFTNGVGVDRIVEVDFGANLALVTRVLGPKGTIGTYSSTGVPNFNFSYYDFGYKGARINFVQVYMLSKEERAMAIGDLTALMAKSRLKHSISRTFSLENIVDAHKAQESKDRVGNIIVKI